MDTPSKQDTETAVDGYTVDGMTPSRVECPGDVNGLSRVLSDAHSAGEACIVWGGGTRMSVGNVPERYDIAVDVTRLDRVVEYESGDLTIVVEAGTRVGALQAQIAEAGQRLPLDPPHPAVATMGGTVASNATGPLRTGFAGAREMVLGMKIVQPDGVITKSGGRVVKNVQGYDLHRLHIGALGTLGVIAEVAFKLVPLPVRTRTVAAWFDDLEGAAGVAMQVFGGQFTPEALTVYSGPAAAGVIRDLAPPGTGDTVSHLLLARVTGGEASVARQVDMLTGAVGAAGAAGCEVLDGDDGQDLWETTIAGPAQPAVTARATLKPSAAFEYLGALERATQDSGVLELAGAVHAGFGTVVADWVSADTEAGGALAPVIGAAFEEAHARGGGAVIERCSPEIKKTLDVFGQLGPELEIMRRLKSEFDPGRNLSPGRFAGRI